MTIDVKYNGLRAITRVTETLAKRPKLFEDLHAARVARKIKCHFTKLNRKSWRTFCTTLDPRKPTSFIWRAALGLNTVPQQPDFILALTLSQGCDELTAVEAYCALPTATTATAILALNESHAALSSFNSVSSPGHDGVR